jgi:thiamine-phosphate pyrophosphorylase
MNAVNFRLYLVTDRKQVPGQDLDAAVRQALEGGVRSVQLREKDLSDREVYELGRELRTLTHEFGASLFVNDRADLARAVNADGVHLTQNSYSASDARRIIGEAGLIGVSTHSLKQAKKAEQEGADFITLGPVFETPSKKAYGPPVEIALLEQVVHAVRVPVFAIGGIKKNNIDPVLHAGAHGIALISGILAAPEIKQAAREFVTLVDRTNSKAKNFDRITG